MPGLFSRRRGSSAQPPANRPSTSAAASAASQAFINQSKSATLSSSAAAAALRTHTISPEPVGNLVTKRMERRGSTSSNGRTSSLQGRGGLQRRNSGSMTERSFRSASPSPSRLATPVTNHPPVPSIPRTLRGPDSKRHRPGSTEPPTRVFSPAPKATRSASLDQSNRSSLNFSRPRVASPEPPKMASQVRTPAQTTANQAQTSRAQSLDSTRLATNKKVHTSGGWFAGPVGNAPPKAKPAPIQTASQEMEEVMVYDANSRTFVKSKRPKKVEPPSPIAPAHPTPVLKPGDYDPATRKIVPHPEPVQPVTPVEPVTEKRPATLHKQPSIVPEEPEAERAAEEATKHNRSLSLDVPSDRARQESLSPSRARFSASPIVTNVLHEPPKRGISPGKSAMKHSPSSSVRTASPSTNFSPQDGDTTSLTSDGSTGGKKRKSVRVSFGDAASIPKPVEKVDSDDEDYSSPRPLLPSFGSVRRGKNDPLPPEVTSKDVADESDDEPAQPVSQLTIPTQSSVETTTTQQTGSTQQMATSSQTAMTQDDVPAINLHPPTPGIEESPKELATDDESPEAADSQEIRELASGVVRYGDESDSSAKDKRPQHVRKSSDADVYADAPETQEAGFASLDAIVESPVSSPVKSKEPIAQAISTPEVEQPAATTADIEEPVTAPPDVEKPVDWSAASAHWNNANQNAQANLSGDEKKPKLSFFKRKKKDDRPASPESPAHAVTLTPTPAHQSATKAPTETPTKVTPQATPSTLAQTTAAATPAQTTPSKVNAHLTKRHSVQNQKPASQHAKRYSAQPVTTAQPLKSALRTPTSPADGLPKTMRNRPASVGSPSANRLSYTASKLKNDSDSESSFKKKRRSKAAQPMRRSMRQSAPARPMSPVSDSGRNNMRQSMRGPRAAKKPNFKSRLAESDSEDERPAYRSRFVDSDDDTIQEELTPVRGIPKRRGQEDGDSTDLDDESETELVIDPAEVEKAMDLARKRLGMRDRDQDKVLIPDVMSDAGSMTSKRRRSFLRGMLGRTKSSQSVPAVRSPSPPPPMPKLENWPLPDGTDERPQTTDGVHTTPERPQNRRSFSARVGFTDDAVARSEKAEAEDAVFSQRTGRKKKFGLLRRAFGLYD